MTHPVSRWICDKSLLSGALHLHLTPTVLGTNPTPRPSLLACQQRAAPSWGEDWLWGTLRGDRRLPFCGVQMAPMGAASGRGVITRVPSLMAGGWLRAPCRSLLTGGAYHATWGQEASKQSRGQPGPAGLGPVSAALARGPPDSPLMWLMPFPHLKQGLALRSYVELGGARLGQVQKGAGRGSLTWVTPVSGCQMTTGTSVRGWPPYPADSRPLPCVPQRPC